MRGCGPIWRSFAVPGSLAGLHNAIKKDCSRKPTVLVNSLLLTSLVAVNWLTSTFVSQH